MPEIEENLEESWPVPDKPAADTVKPDREEETRPGEGEFLLNLLSEKSRKGLVPLAGLPRDAALKAFLSGGASMPQIESLRLSPSHATRLITLIGAPIGKNHEKVSWELLQRISENPPSLLLVHMGNGPAVEDEKLRDLFDTATPHAPLIIALAESGDSPALGAPPAWADASFSLDLPDPVLRLHLQNAIELSQVRKDLETIFLAHRVSREQLHKVTFTDPLTGLMNRAGFEDASARELARLSRNKDTAGLLIIDIDHFKKVNDTFGHPIGDSVLRELGRILRIETRYIDHVVRFGGEEFGVILPHTDFDNISLVAERIRRQVEATLFLGLPAPGAITVSVGALCIHSSRNPVMDDVYSVADELLYQAKQKGRNRVVTATYE